MLIGFPPIFAADTKIIYGYNFVTPLKINGKQENMLFQLINVTSLGFFKNICYLYLHNNIRSPQHIFG